MYETIEETSAGKCPYCGEEMVKHIIKEGARYHVTSWGNQKNGAASHCSTKNCENNHGPGYCVPEGAGKIRKEKTS
jgi:hypothetical protein